jgi:hypothetical protein
VTGLAREAAGWLATGGASAFATLGVLRYLAFRTESAASGFGRLLAAPVAARVANGVPDGLVDELFPDPGYTARAGFLHLVQADVASVLALVADQQQPLVVFVDDLDRCSPRVVSQVIEVLNLFLAGEFENGVFVLAMEPDLVAAHVEVAYGDLVAKLRELGAGRSDRLAVPRQNRPAADQPSAGGQGPRPSPVPAGTARPATGGARRPGRLLGRSDLPSPRCRFPDRCGGRHSTPARPLGAPVPHAVPAPQLIDQAEAMIRRHAPTAESLPEITHRVERVLLAPMGIPAPAIPGELTGLVAHAADRVYADLLGDRSAYAALTAGLPSLGSVSPREVRRYLNLFRFYAFIAFRRRRTGRSLPTWPRSRSSPR